MLTKPIPTTHLLKHVEVEQFGPTDYPTTVYLQR
jgi:hypothetical protein